MDKAWRVVERALIVAGFIVAAATLYYTAAPYYQGEHGTPTSGGSSMNTPWWIFAAGAIAFALLITGWGMMFVRSDKPRAIATNLRLQFHANNLIPTCLDMHNIANWYSLRHEFNVSEERSKKFPKGREQQYRFWTLHIVFDRPVALRQIVFDGHGAQLPTIEVKDRSARHTVIYISGDMPAAILDVNVIA